jgi:predicted transcriptional regulator
MSEPEQPDVREELHRLVDVLPEAEIHAAGRYLQYAQDRGTHLHSIENAPFDDEPLTDEDIAAIQEAQAEIERGEYLTTEELIRDLGIAEPPPIAYGEKDGVSRADLHRLVDELPHHERYGARQYLEYLIEVHWEPVLEDDLTEEELTFIAEGRREVERGEYVSLEELTRGLGL